MPLKEPPDYNWLLHDSLATIKNGRAWTHNQKKVKTIHTDPKYHDYDIERVAIDDLIRDNDLDNPVALNNHAAIWSPSGDEDDIHPDQFKYDPSKDSDPNDIIYGTRQLDGSIKLGNGRHRIRALKNGGYTHAVIPIHDALVGTNGAFASDFYSNDIGRARVLLKYLPYSEFSKEQRELLKQKINKKIQYIKYLDEIKNRR